MSDRPLIQVASSPVKVHVRVLVRDHAESFYRPVTGYDDAEIRAVVDHFEGQVGTVFNVRTMGGVSLYQGMVEEGEV